MADPHSSSYTVDDALNGLRPFDPFQWMMLCYTGMSWLCDAMEVMVLSYLGPSVSCSPPPPRAPRPGTSRAVGATGSTAGVAVPRRQSHT
jgi:hypothetical protein